MTGTTILGSAVLSLTLVAASASFAATLSNVELNANTTPTSAASFGLAGISLDLPKVSAQETFETAQARQSRAERRANLNQTQTQISVNAPFGFLADGVTPRTQPQTRSDARLSENDGVLQAADSFFNENNR